MGGIGLLRVIQIAMAIIIVLAIKVNNRIVEIVIAIEIIKLDSESRNWARTVGRQESSRYVWHTIHQIEKFFNLLKNEENKKIIWLIQITTY